MSSLLESVRGLGRKVVMPGGLPAQVAVVTATYRSWSPATPEGSVVEKFAVLRARLGPEGYQAERFSIWDADAEGRNALARRVSYADVVVGGNLLGSHYRAWTGSWTSSRSWPVPPTSSSRCTTCAGAAPPRVWVCPTLPAGALGQGRETSKRGSGLSPAQVLWDDVTSTLTLWEMAVRLRAVPVSGRPVTIDDAGFGELAGREPRFAGRAGWAEQAADLVLPYPAECDSQFREGSPFARDSLLSRAEYPIPSREVMSTSEHGPAMAWLLAAEEFASAAQVLSPVPDALNVTASWKAHRLLWANYGPLDHRPVHGGLAVFTDHAVNARVTRLGPP